MAEKYLIIINLNRSYNTYWFDCSPRNDGKVSSRTQF